MLDKGRRAPCMRTLVAILTLTATMVLASCTADDSDDSSADGATKTGKIGEGKTLTVANWKDYGSDSELAIKGFEELTGATVEHQYINSYESLFQTLRSGGLGEIDVANMSLTYVQPGAEQSLLQPVSEDEITVWNELEPTLRENEGLRSEGELYAVPWVWGSTSLFYNPADFSEPLDSWEALWDPANAGRVGFFDEPITAIQTAALYLGEDPYDPDLDAVKEALIELKDNTSVIWASGDDWFKAYETGSIQLGNAWSGSIGDITANGGEVEYVVPNEGTTGWQDSWTVVAETPERELAIAWINYMSGSDFQTEWANDPKLHSPAPSNHIAYEKLTPENLERVSGGPEWLNGITFQQAMSQEQLQEWTQLWQEVLAA